MSRRSPAVWWRGSGGLAAVRVGSLVGLVCVGACTSDGGLKVHNDAPVASIEQPLDGGSVVEGAEVELLGRVSDRQDGPAGLAASWFLGGASVCPEATVDEAGATRCVVRLTEAAEVVLRATDGDGATGEDAIALEVEDDAPPTVELTEPGADAVLYATRAVELGALLDDDRDQPSDLGVRWTTPEGELSVSGGSTDSDGSHSATASLPAGSYALTVTVEDALGQTGSDAVSVVVHAENTPPDCAFTDPDEGTAVALGDSLRIAGTASDGQTAAAQLDTSLSSDLDGPLAAGALVAADGVWSHSTDALSGGVHTLTFTVSDDYGDSCVARRAVEICDAVWYRDGDGDGHGDADEALVACVAPTDFVAVADDCDDTRADVGPSAPERCDGVDNDCDTLVDDDDPGVDLSTGGSWWTDGDGDGEGDPAAAVDACVQPAGTVGNDTDCDDGDATVGLTATEICDAQDNDCDTLVDDADPDLDLSTASDFYADSDGDSYGDASASTRACLAPADHVSDDTDCDDTDAWTHPGATELCDGVQNDCSSAWTDDDGLASFWTTSSSSWADVSATWSAGSLASPASIALATAGTLHLCTGTWPVWLTVSADVELIGVDGAADVVLSGGDADTIVSITTDAITVSLTELTLEQGLATQSISTSSSSTASYGGAVFCDADAELEMDSVVLSENTADAGGALAAADCDVALTDTTWSSNTAASSGSMAFLNGGSWTDDGSVYEDNSAPRGGLLLYNAVASFTDVLMDGNTATEGGHAAIYLGASSTLSATRLTVQDTQTGAALAGGEYYGGALWLSTGSTVSIDESSFSGNTANNIAGAIYVIGADLTITDTDFSGNSSTTRGGALFVRNAATVRLDADTVFSGNSAGESGGAIHVAEDCTIEAVGTEFSTNFAGTDGGAVYLDNATLTGSVAALFDSNEAGESGGAVAVEGPDGAVALTDVDLDGNIAGEDGGAISMADVGGTPALTLLRGSVTTNTAAGVGGGVAVDGTVSATTVNFGGTNSPSDTTAGSDDDTWGTAASFSCTATACN